LTNNDLIESYKCAKYIIDNKGKSVRLRVGKSNIDVDRILAHFETESAYFITPENPFSQQLTEEENRLRHERFVTAISELKCPYLTGYGTNEDETWPKENSYLVFSSDESAMHTLATNFGQNGILKVEKGKPVKLLVLEELRYTELPL
jgi:hypothetical protein